jgi:hypothetical protein
MFLDSKLEGAVLVLNYIYLYFTDVTVQLFQGSVPFTGETLA